jgi:hypothetical protein
MYVVGCEFGTIRLKQLREQVHTELKKMEHYPLMYDKDYGKGDLSFNVLD